MIVAIILANSLSMHVNAQKQVQSLLDAREGFKTEIQQKIQDDEPFPPPPEQLFSIVKYPTPIGEMSAYLSKPHHPNKKHPALIWLTGGFPAGGSGASAWEPTSSDNDQSAKIYRQSGVLMMYPALRGSFGNPGVQEGVYGEVNDVLSALDYLSKLDYVDTNRIYLGGHSTGGTLALLVAASTNRFCSVFSFGPVADPASYGSKAVIYNSKNDKEQKLRAPVNFLSAIKSPTYIIEGVQGNIDSLEKLEQVSRNNKLHFFPIQKADHFSILAPINQLIAEKIANASNCNISLNNHDAQVAFDDLQITKREVKSLQTLTHIRNKGVDLRTPRLVKHYLLSREKETLAQSAKPLKRAGFIANKIEPQKDSKGRPYFLLIAEKQQHLLDLKMIFELSAMFAQLEEKFGLHYDGWTVD